MTPSVAAEKPGSQTSSISIHNDAAALVVLQSPFGAIVDPATVRGSQYTTPATVINQAIYAVLSKVFSYEAPGNTHAVDAHVAAWATQFARANSFGIVPFYHQFEVRSGASNAILGFLGKVGTRGQPVTAIGAAQALPYMQPALAGATGQLPLALNLSALDFDVEAGQLVSNYSAPLAAARALGYPVLTPVNTGIELQHLTVLNQYLAALTGAPLVHLFDGPNYTQTNTKVDGLMSVNELGSLYQDLLTLGGKHNLLEETIATGLANLNKLAGTLYTPFEYSGPKDARAVLVVYGLYEAEQVSRIVADSNIGVVKVRIPLPFNAADFVRAIPETAKKVVVLLAPGLLLKADVTAALFLGGIYHRVVVLEYAYALGFVWSPVTVAKIAEETLQVSPESILPAPQTSVDQALTATTAPVGSYLLWGRDNGVVVKNADRLALALSLDSSKQVSLRTKYDNGRAGGLFQAQLVSALAPPTTVDAADVVVVDDVSVLNAFDVLATAKPGLTIIVGVSKNADTVVDKLPLDFKKGLVANHNALVVVDFSVVDTLDKVDDLTKGFSADFLLQLAFWRAALPELDGLIVNKLLQANGNGFELLAAVLDKFVALVDEHNALIKVEPSPEWFKEEPKEEETKADAEEKTEDEEEEAEPLPFFPAETAFAANPRIGGGEDAEEVFTAPTLALAKRIAFPEAFGTAQALRPDLPVKNFVVKVQENKRLTPAEYLRNIFHIEFDTTGTGLKYEIGEALGIHARNPAAAVDSFLEFYGVDGNSVVEVTHKDDPTLFGVRSARQALTENVDFLGKPPKRFYELLAPYATEEKQRKQLEMLASGDGAAQLKKRQDEDFVTYVDLLEEFSSARPSFADLVKIIAPMKRREYSIASSQKIHPNAVHLLIVVVDWVDPKGRPRFGQCSKYLSDLPVGSELVVLVKPSVMKLPPLTTQPIVMLGLGTGLAPFKAFIEEKVWQQLQGHEVGEIYLYMGSRHKKEEYLYGELWEAYFDAGLLTHIGAAFSRDQPQKIYIQDKIRDTIEDLTDAIVTKNGSFYLCGPTWPVPDITACLEDIVQNAAKREGKEVKDVAKVVEDMKEEGRYILEVY